MIGPPLTQQDLNMPSDDMPTSPDHSGLHAVLRTSATELAPLLPRLKAVITDREDAFLQLGAKIFGINAHASGFSKAASDMASSVGEGALLAAMNELRTLASEARDVFASVSATDQVQGMSEVLSRIATLDRAILQFSTLIQILKMLEIATRIESARLGSVGTEFTTLADDVKSLASKIGHNTSMIRDHIARLESQLATANERDQKQIKAQQGFIENMFAQLFASVSRLEDMRADSATLVGDLARGSRQVTENMGQIIASVQFHDITRQQVEHVEEILVQAREEIMQLTAETEPLGLASWVKDVLSLQTPQLRQAREMFGQAVGDLIANLTAIASRIQDLGSRTKAVAYADKHGGEAVLETIRRQISQVVQAMHSAGAHVAESSRTMSDMAETVGTVGTFVKDIEEIGAEIELIALNAIIKAAHTGDQGRALGVLAVEIQQVSVQARSHTAHIALSLNNISEKAEAMAALARSIDIAEVVDGIRTRFEAVIARMASLDTELRASITHLSGLSGNLVKEIQNVTSSIQVHNLVSKELLWLEQQISTLENALVPYNDTLKAARQPEKLREQLSRYTMDSERLVHLAVLGQASGVVAQDDVELFGGDVELFGDDVELFDQSAAPEARTETTALEDDLGDNVELF